MFYQIIFIYSFLHFFGLSFIHSFTGHSFPFSLSSLFPFFLRSFIHTSHFRCNTIMVTRGATMVIVEIDSPTFRLITLIIRGKSRKNEGLLEPVGRIAKTSWPRRTRFKQIFYPSRKDSSCRKCSIALFIVASMSV